MIRTRGLSKRFGQRILWENVDIDIERHKMLALVGPSGSGKSTLLNCLGLLEDPSSGDILFNEEKISDFGPAKRRKFRLRHLGYLFQNYALMESATVRENLAVVSRDREKHSWALDRVGLQGMEKDKVHRLSGGEQQRVALARLMVKDPDLVLADEPTGALDDGNSRIVIDVLQEMAEKGCSVVIATHSSTVWRSCDDVFDVGEYAASAQVPAGQ